MTLLSGVFDDHNHCEQVLVSLLHRLLQSVSPALTVLADHPNLRPGLRSEGQSTHQPRATFRKALSASSYGQYIWIGMLSKYYGSF